jgi:glucose-6-phosphate 1-dehydrogenase
MGEGSSDAFVFFGATGDLVFKQIFPALQGLVNDEGLEVPLIGVARSPWTQERFLERARESLVRRGMFVPADFARLARLLRYVSGDYGAPQTYAQVREALGVARAPLYYMAVPPDVFPVVAQALADSGCAAGAGLVVEKPFGRDFASAVRLDQVLHEHFPEAAIFRIDHFLGKEPVRNIAYMRFANPMFEQIWSREHVRSIQITMAEDFGVESRGSFYEQVGTIRDVVQNHLLQILASLTAEAPARWDSGSFREQKERVLAAMRPLDPARVVRGQYAGYRSTAGVAEDSRVETYAALRVTIDTDRWDGVPMYIRAGKKLVLSATEIVVDLKRPARDLFGESLASHSNHLRIRISPDVTIALGVRVKNPGEGMTGRDVELALVSCPRDDKPAYQPLFSDAMKGDPELFVGQAGVEASWRVVDPILGDVTPLYPYEPGTWGPPAAEALIGDDGPWLDPVPGYCPL